jgi:hypothetical protein
MTSLRRGMARASGAAYRFPKAAALRALLLSIGAAAIVLGIVASSGNRGTSAASVTPTPQAGNIQCSKFGLLKAAKLEEDQGEVVDGPFKLTANDVQFSGTLDVHFNTDTPPEPVSFDWTSTLGIDAVLVGGANQTNVYHYDEALGDTGLTTPTGQAISHIIFCFDKDLATMTPTNTRTPTDTPTSASTKIWRR